ncbi:4'-phosphopantetheinyl transferase [Streptomyces violascens]|uniref:4'-phosphopantetheinyl transferase n=1 Tax=Streptomyces violascens TaxID=67381 RepID=UPI00378A072D
MIADLLPSPVETVEVYGDPADPAPLFPEEERLVADAVPERRREFSTVRACARTALSRLGAPRTPLLPGSRGAPLWPAGVVGSMTHCEGYRAAAVARAADVTTIGVDAEPNRPLRERGVLELVTLPQERYQIDSLSAQRPEVCWDRLVFSAKESVYKAWYPLTGRFLDFDEALLSIDPEGRRFTARLLVDGLVVDGVRVTQFSGVWAAGAGVLLTAIALRTPSVRAVRPQLLGGVGAVRR